MPLEESLDIGAVDIEVRTDVRDLGGVRTIRFLVTTQPSNTFAAATRNGSATGWP